MDDTTLGGYLQRHSRPPAFEGGDGVPYSVDLYVDDVPDDSGRYGAALLFVRWTPGNTEPTGHLETEYLVHGEDPSAARSALEAMSLYDVKEHLDRMVASQRDQDDR